MIAVRQFAIVDHEPIDRGPNAGIFHTDGSGDGNTELFVLAEGTTPAGHEFAGHVVTAIGQMWRTLDLSLTGALRTVFAEAAKNVRDWNEKSLANQVVELGLTCVARRGDQAVIAMAGPSVAYHVGAGGLRTFAPHDDAAAPFTGNADLEPTLERVELCPGDQLLMLTAEAAQSLESRALAGVLQMEPSDILRELYVRVRDLGQVTAVLLSPEGTAQPAAASARLPAEVGAAAPVIGAATVGAPVHRSAVAQPSLFVDGGSQENVLELARQRLTKPLPDLYVSQPPAEEAVEVATLRRVSGDESLSRLASVHRARAATEPAASTEPNQAQPTPPPNPSPATRWRLSGQPRTPADSAREHRNRSFSRTLHKESSPAAPRNNSSEARPVSEMASERRADAGAYRRAETLQAGPLAAEGIAGEPPAPLIRMRDDMGGRWRSGGNLGGGIGISMPPTWFVAFIGIAVFLILIGMLVLPGTLKEESAQQQTALLDQAQQQLQIANVQENPSRKREALNVAQATALEALAFKTDNTLAQTVVNDVQGAIAVLDAVASPASVETIGSLEQFGNSPVAATRMVIGETDAYILDGESGSVIAMSHETDEAELIYVASEEHARPVALAYAEIATLGGGETLLIMDSLGGLWQHAPGETIKAVTISPPEAFSPTDIAVFEGELYILDASNGVVLQFAPGGVGFDTPPSVALESAELNTARRLMVVDQEIITVNDGGDVWRFSGDLPLLLAQSGIDERLVTAESPQPFGAGGQLAVLDAAQDRIVVLERNGTFLQQIRHEDFQGITAFAMRVGVGYVYSGGLLRRVEFLGSR